MGMVFSHTYLSVSDLSCTLKNNLQLQKSCRNLTNHHAKKEMFSDEGAAQPLQPLGRDQEEEERDRGNGMEFVFPLPSTMSLRILMVSASYQRLFVSIKILMNLFLTMLWHLSQTKLRTKYG